MTPQPTIINQEAPIKLMVEDLRRVSGSGNKLQGFPWKIQVSAGNSKPPTVIQFSQVWLQGSVKSGSDLDTVVLNDGSGSVRVERCGRVPGDRTWVEPGAYCGVLACVKRPSKPIPEVEAIKLMHIDEKKSEAESMWPLEVQELLKFLAGEITFTL